MSPSPLAGKVFDETGEPLYVQAAVKDRRRYRYYVSRALVRGSKVEGQRGWRVPAPELERAVAIAARSILDDKAAILEALQVAGMGDADINPVFTWWLNGGSVCWLRGNVRRLWSNWWKRQC